MDCEQHHNVQTGDFCPVCLVEDRARLRDAGEQLVVALRKAMRGDTASAVRAERNWREATQ